MFTATLACRSLFDGTPHRVTFTIAPPTLGDGVWCFRCNQMSRVIRTPYEYVARCQSDCSFGWGQTPRRDANYYQVSTWARGHAQTRRGHLVTIKHKGVLVRVFNFPAESLLTG